MLENVTEYVYLDTLYDIFDPKVEYLHLVLQM